MCGTCNRSLRSSEIEDAHRASALLLALRAPALHNALALRTDSLNRDASRSNYESRREHRHLQLTSTARRGDFLDALWQFTTTRIHLDALTL